MDFFNSNIETVEFNSVEQQASARKFISNVYLYMMGALLITGIIAYRYGTIEFIERYYLVQTPKGTQIAPLFYVVALSLFWFLSHCNG